MDFLLLLLQRLDSAARCDIMSYHLFSIFSFDINRSRLLCHRWQNIEIALFLWFYEFYYYFAHITFIFNTFVALDDCYCYYYCCTVFGLVILFFLRYFFCGSVLLFLLLLIESVLFVWLWYRMHKIVFASLHKHFLLHKHAINFRFEHSHFYIDIYMYICCCCCCCRSCLCVFVFLFASKCTFQIFANVHLIGIVFPFFDTQRFFFVFLTFISFICNCNNFVFFLTWIVQFVV